MPVHSRKVENNGTADYDADVVVDGPNDVVRGIGLIDARHMFGIGAVKPDQVIDLVVHFEPWDENKVYDRLGNETHFTEILGVKIPYFVVPVRPGRNLAAILELAAMNNRERKMGYNAAQVLVERHDRMVDEG